MIINREAVQHAFLSSHKKVKVKITFALEQAIKAQMGSKALLFL
jgi:hypothetical protein